MRIVVICVTQMSNRRLWFYVIGTANSLGVPATAFAAVLYNIMAIVNFATTCLWMWVGGARS